MKNWKTTSMGISAIVSGITGIVYALKSKNLSPEIISASTTGILVGIGLIFAKDFNVTGIDK
jgi:ABC-type branched-subunit amino acid transport system permease subunit